MLFSGGVLNKRLLEGEVVEAVRRGAAVTSATIADEYGGSENVADIARIFHTRPS
jgi:hypothetical protein